MPARERRERREKGETRRRGGNEQDGGRMTLERRKGGVGKERHLWERGKGVKRRNP